MINNVVVSGYVGQIVREGGEGKPFSFTMCYTKNYFKDGEWNKINEWFLVSTFGPSKDRLADTISKGDFVEVSGEIKNYEKDGNRGYFINANYIGKINRNKSTEDEGHESIKENNSSGKASKKAVVEEPDDDLPF